jgi:hypothetical protein
MRAIALLASFNFFVAGFGELDDCFAPGECLSGTHVGGSKVHTVVECLELCTSTDGEATITFERHWLSFYSFYHISGCSWFTFYPSSSYCNLMEGCNNLSTEECKGKQSFNARIMNLCLIWIFLDCLSGEAGCEMQPVCFITGECDGNVIRAVEHVPDR